MTIHVLNGPQPRPARHPRAGRLRRHHYAELAALCERTGRELGLEVEVRQTDDEARDAGLAARGGRRRSPGGDEPRRLDALLLRAARRLARSCNAPWSRCTSPTPRPRGVPAPLGVSAVATGVIAGLGVDGYLLALGWLAQQGVK